MSATEFAFLALGLVLGIAVGAAVVVVFRARPAPRREVRLTVSPNSIAVRRATTLASAEHATGTSPAHGGPSVDARPAGARAPRPVMARDLVHAPAGTPRIGTPVPEIAVRPLGTAEPAPIAGGMGPAAAPATAAPIPGRPAPSSVRSDHAFSRTTAVATAPSGSGLGALTGPAVTDTDSRRVQFTLEARPVMDVGAPRAQHEIRVRPAGALAARLELSAAAVGIPIRPETQRGDPDARGSGGAGRAGVEVPDEARACATERRLAAERCEVAGVARAHAAAAADHLSQARRSYDALRQRVDEQERLADPHELRAAKDAAHQAFREVQTTAADTDATETAAREWLDAINRLNNVAVAAAASLEVDRDELRRLVPTLERMSIEADAARIAAESAEAGCREAREVLAGCEEVEQTTSSARVRSGPEREAAPGWPTDQSPGPLGGAHEPDGTTDTETTAPRILRIFSGDRPAREALVVALAGQDPDQQRRWRLVLAEFVDAVVARSIEDGYLEVLAGHPFWAMFDRTERRVIVTALSALGFRFDGLGGFADGRAPGQRDLSLAVGYAGLDRMRVRNWPREAELAQLFAGATVAADEWLIAQAGDLSLGRMIDALGSRSGELADAWNAWGRIRPLLVATDPE